MAAATGSGETAHPRTSQINFLIAAKIAFHRKSHLVSHHAAATRAALAYDEQSYQMT
jgi:hypothetical protein